MSQFNNFVNDKWRPVVGYEGQYEVSNKGEIRRDNDTIHPKRAQILISHKFNNASRRIVLSKNKKKKAFLVRDLVAAAFLGEPPSPGHSVVFLDGDAENINAENLQYRMPDSCGPYDDSAEEWKAVVGYELVYEVSSIGRVRRVDGRQGTRAGKVRSRYICKAGYYCIVLNWNRRPETFYIHQLVAGAFLGDCPEGMEVNHKNCNKLDNSPGNLEYITHPDNMRHAYENGLFKIGSQRRDAKLNEILVRVIKLNLQYDRQCTVGRWFGLSANTISRISLGTCWKHVIMARPS